MNSAKCRDELCFLVLNLRSFGGTYQSVEEFSISLTNFPPSLIGILSVILSRRKVQRWWDIYSNNEGIVLELAHEWLVSSAICNTLIVGCPRILDFQSMRASSTAQVSLLRAFITACKKSINVLMIISRSIGYRIINLACIKRDSFSLQIFWNHGDSSRRDSWFRHAGARSQCCRCHFECWRSMTNWLLVYLLYLNSRLFDNRLIIQRTFNLINHN